VVAALWTISVDRGPDHESDNVQVKSSKEMTILKRAWLELLNINEVVTVLPRYCICEGPAPRIH